MHLFILYKPCKASFPSLETKPDKKGTLLNFPSSKRTPMSSVMKAPSHSSSVTGPNDDGYIFLLS